MAWKDAILERLSWMRQALERRDLPPEPPRADGEVGTASFGPSGRETAQASAVASRGERATGVGPYAPLIEAIRAAMERFVATDVRLHLAIAARDRFLLQAIEVKCDEDVAASVLQRFREEFKPEQIKRFLARDVIGGLPNAAAIDLSQFEGLRGGDRQQPAGSQDSPYAALIAALNEGVSTDQDASAYKIALEGRWYEDETAVEGRTRAADTATPLAGDASLKLLIEDRAGTRELMLPAIVPGRRYSIGKDPSSDIVVDATFASRRHCELWLDRQRWWTEDVASTNGTRVESEGSVLGVSGGARAGREARAAIVEVPPGAQIVLSARARGPAADYPRIIVQGVAADSQSRTPLAPGASSPQTPVTPIAGAAGAAARFIVEASTADGVRSVPLDAARLPWSVGRSRRSAMVVPRAHEGVSGHHLDVVALDERGAEILVHGDNGVRVADFAFGPGDRFHLRAGELLEFGRARAAEPLMTLKLTRDAAGARDALA